MYATEEKLNTGLFLTMNSPKMQNISSTSRRIAIKSIVPGAEKANNPVEKVSTQNISGPVRTIVCSVFNGLLSSTCFWVRNFSPRNDIIMKYM